MPTYLNCPHCEHPQILPGRRRGKAVFCRQCGWAYQTSVVTGSVRPLHISTMGELRSSGLGRKSENLFVIEN